MTQPPGGYIEKVDSGQVTETPGSLRPAVMRGLRWKALTQLTAQGSRTVVMIILARLLLPDQFGLAGMVLVFAGLIQVFADVGFSASIIQHKILTDADRSTAFWTNVAVGLLLTATGVAISPFVARFYGHAELKPLLIVLSSSFAIASLGSTHASLLTREMRFRELESTASIATLAGAAAAVALALAGAGAWALIAQTVITSAATTLLLWSFLHWAPRFTVSRESLRKLWGFGGGVFGSKILTYLGLNTDNFLVGKFLGASALGFYSMAYSVIAVPWARLLGPITGLLVPMFARLQDDRARTRAAWLKGIRICMALIAPLTFGLVVVAPQFVRVLLGPHWLPIVHVVQVLAYVVFIQSTVSISPLVFASQYRTGLLLRVTIISFAAHLTGFVVGLHWGVLGVAVGYAISNTLVAVPLQLYYPARLLDANAGEVFGAVVRVVEAAGLMALAVLGARLGLSVLGLRPVVILGAGVAIGLLTYPPLLVWREPLLAAEISLPSRLQTIVDRITPGRRHDTSWPGER